MPYYFARQLPLFYVLYYNSTSMANRGDELIQSRKDKLAKLKQAGINPYPGKVLRGELTGEARLKSIGQIVSVAGRLISWRNMGGSTFAGLRDTSGEIQLWFKKDNLTEAYDLIKNFDVGDFLQAEGKLMTTKAGELTVEVNKFTLLTKSIRPIPSDHYGLKDIELRLRKRYLDLLVNPTVKELFLKKAAFWQNVRSFLVKHGFVEVETPVLELIPGGAEARPFVTHHNALDIDEYLRISLELYQKRLLVGGFEKTFEIGRIFRNEGIDAEHLQDYTQMEFYWAYANYEDLMQFTQEMFKHVIQLTFGTLTITSHGHTVDWAKPWARLDYFDAFQEKTGIDLSKTSIGELKAKAKELGIKHEPNLGKGRLIDLVYKKTVRPFIIEPTHLIHHPVDVSPLSKCHPDNPQKAERVQTLAYGTELSNGYSELNDPIDQRNRFEEQAKLRAAGDQEAQMMDEDFVEALEYGMPPAAGFGMSERVFAYLVDLPIREAVFFPMMKPEKERTSSTPVIASATPAPTGATSEGGQQSPEVTAKPQSSEWQPIKPPQNVIVGSKGRATPESTALDSPASQDSGQVENHEQSRVAGMTENQIEAPNTFAEGSLMIKDDAQKIVDELLKSQNLKNHCYAAGAAMATLYDQFEVEARHEGTTRQDWAIAGMLHDVDYEATDKQLELHTEVATDKLREFIAQHPESKDQVERIIKAVRGHADKAPRDILMAKAIYAADELTGLIVAAALVRPDKKLDGLTVDSILKRFKEPSFAKGANRDQIKTCETELGLPLDVFTEIVLDAMKKIHDQLGL